MWGERILFCILGQMSPSLWTLSYLTPCFPSWLLREVVCSVLVIGRCTPFFLASHNRTWEYFLVEPMAELNQGCCTDVDYKSLRAVLWPRSYRSIYLLPSVWEKVTVVCLPEFSLAHVIGACATDESWSGLVCWRAQASWSALCSGFLAFQGFPHCPDRLECFPLFSCLTRSLKRAWLGSRKEEAQGVLAETSRSSESGALGGCNDHAANRSQQKKEGDEALEFKGGLNPRPRDWCVPLFRWKQPQMVRDWPPVWLMLSCLRVMAIGHL